MHKEMILALVSISTFFALASFAQAQMGLGIWPAKFDAHVPFLGRFHTYIYLFNPSNKDAEVTLGFRCKNCSEKFDFLGIKGQKISYLEYSTYPEKMFIEKNTMFNDSKGFRFSLYNTIIMRNELVLSNLRIPYWSLNIGKKTVEGEVQATLANQMVSLTVTSEAKITLEGINPLFLLLFVSVIVFLVTLLIYRRQKLEIKKLER